jgi:DNA-binding NtrC family response regulator
MSRPLAGQLKVVAVAMGDLVDDAGMVAHIHLHGPMDGVEAAQQIWIQAKISVVFMSGYTTVETSACVWRTVPADYLSKPFFNDQLRAALEQTLETRRRQSSQRPHSQC